MAGRKLAVTTIVSALPGSGESFAVFGPGDEVPKWAADQLGDHCWEGGEPSKGSEPPRAGKGSGLDAWVAFADGKVEVADDDSRDAIIAKLEKAGHIAPAQ